jgi:mono/diheme cytochrome c family protein
MLKFRGLSIFLLTATAAFARFTFAEPTTTSSRESIEQGRYLVRIAGCNDCHTPGYPEAGGEIPEQQWLVGDRLGWRGPWGTTYPGNLRLYMYKVTEDEWMKAARTTQFRPPMPWFTLHHMREQDLRDLYRFIHSLGPAGEPAPAYLPPGQEPKGPYVLYPQPPK